MTTVSELYEAAKKLRLREELPEMIRETGGQIAVKVENQLSKGELSTKAKITPTYKSDTYANVKARMNAAPGYSTPDLRYSGDYYKGIGVAILSDKEYAIESDVPYANDASIAQYGDNLLRLSEQSKEEYIEETLLPKIQTYITEITGLTFE